MSSWSDLPLDLLRDVSGRLHVAADFVRFHAVCKPWRDAAPPPASYPTFLPFLVAPLDVFGLRTALCVFSRRRRSASSRAIPLRDRRWLINGDDGTAARLLAETTGGVLPNDDPLTGGDVTLPPPFPGEMKGWANRAVGGVSGDGAIFLYAVGRDHRGFYDPAMKAAVLRPGSDVVDAAWASMEADWPWSYSPAVSNRCCCAAYHGGAIVLCVGRESWCVGSPDVGAWMDDHLAGKTLGSYVLESRGELLWAFVQAKRGREYDDGRLTVGALASLPSVAVYALDDGASDGEPRWVRRDGRSLADRVLFLGRPSSFAVDAARLGVDGGGCAYFVDRRALYGEVWSKSPVKRCRVFRYSFVDDDKSEMVEQLPADHWNDDACMWVTPQPSAIAPTM